MAAERSFVTFRRKVLVLFAHPSPDRSEVNWPMMQATAGVEGVINGVN